MLILSQIIGDLSVQRQYLHRYPQQDPEVCGRPEPERVQQPTRLGGQAGRECGTEAGRQAGGGYQGMD